MAAWRASRTGRALRFLAFRSAAAVNDSELAVILGGLRQCDPQVVLRAAGYAVASASVTHAICLRIWPPLTVGQVPLVTNAAFVVGGLALAWSPHLANAWRSAAARRLLSY
jgi:hypothetical protein